MKLTNPQKTISADHNRFRVVVAGRRFGKSYLSINELAKLSLTKSVCMLHQRIDKQRQLYGTT